MGSLERVRVPIHEIRGDLIQAQADSVGLPLWTVPLPNWAKIGQIYAQADPSARIESFSEISS